MEGWTEPDPELSVLEISCISSEESMCSSAGNGEQVKVCGLELDWISVLFKEHNSDGILKIQHLREKEGRRKEGVSYNNVEEGK